MTVKEFLNEKYLNKMKNISEREWKCVQEAAACKKVHPAEILYRSFEITQNDIKANGGYNGELWNDIKDMHSKKLLASNKHRQEHGHIDRYWLTAKGYKSLKFD